LYQHTRETEFTYLFGHLVLDADALSFEKVLEGFLFLAVHVRISQEKEKHRVLTG
jgi:hypothetical protein